MAFGLVETGFGLGDAGYVFCALVGAAALASGAAVARSGGRPADGV